jgi:hypothetical protein
VHKYIYARIEIKKIYDIIISTNYLKHRTK